MSFFTKEELDDLIRLGIHIASISESDSRNMSENDMETLQGLEQTIHRALARSRNK